MIGLSRLSSLVVVALALSCRSSETPDWLVQRGREQRRLAQASNRLRDDFRFEDRRQASGITFVNRSVDDAGKNYKLVHYDHGSGLCTADVDGDTQSDLYFLTQLGTNELWKNAGNGRFVDMTATAGLTIPDAIAVGCAFADIDNDGDPDLFVTTVRHGNHLFENLGAGKFQDITTTAGLSYNGHSAGALFFDYDRDGRLDLFVANVGVFTTDVRGPGGYYVGLSDAFLGHLHPERAELSRLYRNLGNNRFQDVTQAVGLSGGSWSGDATVLDANADGFPDLYILNMQGPDHLWINERGARFRDQTAAYFPRTPWGGMGANVFDADGDGRLDLFVTSMHSDMWVDLAPGDWKDEARKSDPAKMPTRLIPEATSSLIFGNALFANRGEGRFEEISDSAGVETYWPWGPSVGDFNADGWPDLFVTAGMNFPFRYGINSLLLNDSGRFQPREFVLGIEPRSHGETEQVWFTLDCNGGDRGNSLCTSCVHPRSMVMQCRPQAGGQVQITGALGTRSAVALDLDGDGDLDIVTNEFNGPPQVLISDLAQRHDVRSLTVRLRGTRSNRQGLGAEVTVLLPNDRRILKVLDANSGYLSRSDLPLYFGLGKADSVTAIQVRWPSGTTQTVTGPIEAGKPVDIVEP